MILHYIYCILSTTFKNEIIYGRLFFLTPTSISRSLYHCTEVAGSNLGKVSRQFNNCHYYPPSIREFFQIMEEQGSERRGMGLIKTHEKDIVSMLHCNCICVIMHSYVLAFENDFSTGLVETSIQLCQDCVYICIIYQ